MECSRYSKQREYAVISIAGVLFGIILFVGIMSLRRRKKFRHHSLVEQGFTKSVMLDPSDLLYKNDGIHNDVADAGTEFGGHHGGEQEDGYVRRVTNPRSRNRRKSRKAHRGSQEKEVYDEEETKI